MTLDEIKTLVKSSEYEFIRTNERIKDRLIMLTLGGSHAYGTNTSTSDVDIRGCALNSKEDLLGLSNFEQFVNERTDTTIYSFNKLIRLFIDCNPNTIEMLGCKPEHYIELSDVGRELITNRKMFLSKRAVNSFGGYATAQLRRLENALAHDRVSQEVKEEHLRKTLEQAKKKFEERYCSFEGGSLELFTAESRKDNFETEVHVNIDIKAYPARDLSGMLNELTNIVSTYDKLNGRNRKKDDMHLNKHAMHLVRLYLMCFDILEKEEVITYRENDHDFLMEIRNGKYQLEDGTYSPEFFKIVSEFEKRLEYAAENTALPKHPDMKKVEEFVMSVNREVACYD